MPKSGRHTTVRLSDAGRARLQRLALRYGSQVEAMEVALELLERRDLPEDEPSVIGWDTFLVARDTVCGDLGTPILAGATAYREVWSDGRGGTILSRESLVADRVIDA